MRFVYFVLIAVLLAGCASRQDDGMGAELQLRAMHRCSRVSPEIDLVNVPSGTTRFDVKLEDVNDLRKFHGGGSWAHDGSNIIPEGALTRHYMGACPPMGQVGTYQYVISAIAADGQILEVKKTVFTVE
ncbi:MAG: MbtF [Desulfovibrionaceae bacterium]